MPPITVAVAGATGFLGKTITETFLTAKQQHPQSISRVVALTRNATSPASNDLKDKGAHIVEGVLSSASLRGVDVLINAVPQGNSIEEMNVYVDAAVEAGVKMYFAPEFGLDYRLTDVKHPVFDIKDGHIKYAHQKGGEKLKVIAVSNGSFLNMLWTFGPALGVDWKNRKVNIPGSTSVKNAYTHTKDVASSLVRLAILGSENPTSVPEHVYLQGDLKSPRELADLIAKASGDKVEAGSIDVGVFKRSLTLENFPGYLSLIIGQGNDFTGFDHNELVNPGQAYWKWTTFDTFIPETKGALWN